MMINLFQLTFVFHTETSHLICTANQMTGFFMKWKAGPKRVKKSSEMKDAC